MLLIENLYAFFQSPKRDSNLSHSLMGVRGSRYSAFQSPDREKVPGDDIQRGIFVATAYLSIAEARERHLRRCYHLGVSRRLTKLSIAVTRERHLRRHQSPARCPNLVDLQSSSREKASYDFREGVELSGHREAFNRQIARKPLMTALHLGALEKPNVTGLRERQNCKPPCMR
jgi:hypothetical protein